MMMIVVVVVVVVVVVFDWMKWTTRLMQSSLSLSWLATLLTLSSWLAKLSTLTIDSVDVANEPS